MTDYRVVRVYTRERARYEGKELGPAIVSWIKSLRIAARCVVLRGVEGLYESGESVSGAIVEGPYDLPLVIDVIVPKAELERVVAGLERMVVDGLVALPAADLLSFHPSSGAIPAHLLVRDIMTAEVVRAHPDFSVRVAVELLLDRRLKSLPVVDAKGNLLGIITQGDLVKKADMPVRLGLLSSVGEKAREAWLKSMEDRSVEEVMTPTPKTLREDQSATAALHLMAGSGLKRLPVVDRGGILVGILSRIDVLRALAEGHIEVMRESRGGAKEGAARFVRDLGERDRLSIPPDTSLRAATEALAREESQRAAVVDSDGRLVGLVTDEILLKAIDASSQRPALLGLLAGRRKDRVGDIMRRDVLAVEEDAEIGEALRLMTEHGFKRIPVVDAEGRFRGMVRRDSILLAMAEPD